MAAAIDGIVLFDGIAYEIQRLLGKGKGGYSYLARRASALYVVKQIHHEPCSYYQFGNKLDSELRDYALLRDVGIPMPELLAVDRSNERLLKEYIPGETVFSLVQREALPDRCLDQVRGMCDLLYPAGLNIDYFPTNFVPSAGTLYYVDYECNAYEEQWDFEHWGIRYCPRQTNSASIPLSCRSMMRSLFKSSLPKKRPHYKRRITRHVDCFDRG